MHSKVPWRRPPNSFPKQFAQFHKNRLRRGAEPSRFGSGRTRSTTGATKTMADVRTFRAATMRDALDLVREELGADAVILHTRQVERRRLLPWRKPLEEVEITASLTIKAGPPQHR